MTGRLCAIFLVGALLAGCGDGGGETSSASSTTDPPSTTVTTDVTTSSTSTTETTVALPVPRCGSGSSSATFDDASGTYAASVSGVDVDGRTVTFDVVQFLVGDDAVEAYHEEVPDDPEGPPNDVFVKNENPALRTAPVDADVRVDLVNLAVDSDADLDQVGFEDFAAQIDAVPEDALPTGLFWLTFDASEITDICEQFLP